MALREAQRQAAQALSDIFIEHGIAHAFIGGFAVNVLGHNRSTEDVDIEVDIANPTELRDQITRLLIEPDSRFSLVNLKLFFTPTDHPELRVPIETLPIGELGLPRRLAVIQSGDSLSKFFRTIFNPLRHNLTYYLH